MTGIIPAMTERGLPHSDGATACPFVAFEDDRDERSDRPDHRHRCYADIHPAPRAIAHQEAYCLASAFAVCPTFQDWAQREAARARAAGEAQAARAVADRARRGDEDREVPAAGAAGRAAREAADERDREASDTPRIEPAAEWQGPRPVRHEEVPGAPPPRRNPPRDWAAPPPWAGGPGGPSAAGPSAGGTAAGGPATAGGTAAAAGAAAGGVGAAGAGAAGAGGPLTVKTGSSSGPRGGREPRVESPSSPADRESRGLAGSAADRLAAGESLSAGPLERPQHAAPPAESWAPPRSTDRAQAADEELADLVGPRQRARPLDAPPAGPAVGGRRVPPAGTHHEADDAPSWEHPRRFEAYPTIKSRAAVPGLPRLGIMAAAIGIAALALFLLPAVLGWFGEDRGGGGEPGASATPGGGVETASPEPTTPPAPTPQVYVIQSGDTLSSVATRFGVSLDDLLDANQDRIENPDRIAIGDQIIIPVPPPDSFEDPGATDEPLAP